MSHTKVRIEWRRGINGNQGTYVFSPNPSMTRPAPGKRYATLTVPLLDGAIIQELGLSIRNLELKGVLYSRTNSWDDMETSRNNLRDGIGVGPGQLHIISPQRHIRYDAQSTPDGIRFEEQERSNLQDYTITFIVPSSDEINITVTSQTINSNAEII